LIAALRKKGIAGLVEYETRLRDNARNEEVIGDLLFEAHAAWMFSDHGFKVTIRERPDLQICRNDEAVYAEVKHFREKRQDRDDEEIMRTSKDLVSTGILTPTEGCEAWEQIANVAIGKVGQYKEDAPNILVIATDSNSINGHVLSTAVHLYNEEARKEGSLQKLNAFMLVDRWFLWLPDESTERNVYFCPTARCLTPLGKGLASSLADIQRWSTPPNMARAPAL
jgi:hypothetical protein